jgi:hypothetical protein
MFVVPGLVLVRDEGRVNRIRNRASLAKRTKLIKGIPHVSSRKRFDIIGWYDFNTQTDVQLDIFSPAAFIAHAGLSKRVLGALMLSSERKGVGRACPGCSSYDFLVAILPVVWQLPLQVRKPGHFLFFYCCPFELQQSVIKAMVPHKETSTVAEKRNSSSTSL